MSNDNQSNFLSITQASSETGLSQAFWRKAILRKKIPYAKLGRRVLIERSELEAWIAKRVVRPTEAPGIRSEGGRQ